MSKKHGDSMKEMMSVAPLHQKMFFKLLMPKSLSKVKDMKKLWKTRNLDLTSISGLLWGITKTTFGIVTATAIGLMALLLHLRWVLNSIYGG